MQKVIDYAYQKLAEYNLHDWTVEITGCKVNAGFCRQRMKKIEISKVFAPYVDWRDLVLHEIAHALAGPNEGHGKKWRQMCKLVGAKPEVCFDWDTIPDEAFRYKVVCSKCKLGIHRSWTLDQKLMKKISKCCRAKLQAKVVNRGEAPELA